MSKVRDDIVDRFINDTFNIYCDRAEVATHASG